VDVALEMSGSPQAIRDALRIVRAGGRVSLMGIPTESVDLDIARDVIFKGVEVCGIVGRRLYETWYTMKGLLDSGRLDVRPAITHELRFDEYDTGMKLMQNGACGKVIFRP
jgi:threonine 3-dehydrogenase